MNVKIISVIIAATLTIIMVGQILMPVISDAVDDTKVYYNNDYGVLSAAASEPIDYTVEFSGQTSGATAYVYVDGVKVGTIYQGVRAIVLADSYSISQQNNTSSFFVAVGKSVEPANYQATSISLRITDTHSTINMVTSEGTQTLEVDTEWCYYRDDNSTDYRIVDYQSTEHKAYINDPSQVKGSFWSGVTGSFISFDGNSATVYGNYAQTVPTVLSGYTKEMNGVYSFDIGAISGGNRTTGAQFTVMLGTVSVDITSYFLVIPNEVYGQSETDVMYSGILWAIPAIFLIFVMIVLVAVVNRD